ncbi:NUDIX hydrolase domain-like protein [Xylariaceae sp. FL0255]|nr:NUDIX hydrolase domain-like protein [Xylariaceae sp. FL0255]
MVGGGPNVRIGCAVIIMNPEGRILMNKRQGSHGEGEWAFPGGHLDMGESLRNCAEREVLEETDLNIKGVAMKIIAVTADVWDVKDWSYTTNFIFCTYDNSSPAAQQPKIKEPSKCTEWAWVSPVTLRTWVENQREKKKGWESNAIFLPILNLFRWRKYVDLSKPNQLVGLDLPADEDAYHEGVPGFVRPEQSEESEANQVIPEVPIGKYGNALSEEDRPVIPQPSEKDK